MKLALGMTVTFTHRHTYKAPAGKPLVAVVTSIERDRDDATLWDIGVYSEVAEVSYGLRPKHLRAVATVAETPAQRLANLNRANAAKCAKHAVYPIWQTRFAEEPEYCFWPEAVAAVERELR